MIPNPPKPHPDAPASVRIRWIREQIRSYAEMLSACHVLGDDGYPNTHQTEICVAAIQFGRKIGATPQENWMAYQAEWHRGCERARHFLNVLRKRIWPLGKMHVPGERILAEAEAVCLDLDVWVPPELVTAEVRRIAHAARAPKRPRYAKRYAA
jgi:hypothetical protein